jgi:hypothetical protein
MRRTVMATVIGVGLLAACSTSPSAPTSPAGTSGSGPSSTVTVPAGVPTFTAAELVRPRVTTPLTAVTLQTLLVPDGAGALAVWVSGRTMSVQDVYARRWVPGAGWQSVQRLTPHSVGPRIDVSAAGSGTTAVVAWTYVPPRGPAITQAVIRTSRTGGWSAVRTLGDASWSDPSVAAHDGGATVAWFGGPTSRQRAWVASWTAPPDSPSGKGLWTRRVALSGTNVVYGFAAPREGTTSPLVVDDGRTRVVAWELGNPIAGNAIRVQSSASVQGAGWSPATDVTASGDDCLLEALLPVAGGASAVTSCARGGEVALDVRDWSAGGGWAQPVVLAPGAIPAPSTNGSNWADDEASDPATGRAAVIWRHQVKPGEVVVELARRSPDGTWHEAQRLSPTGTTSDGPHVAVSGSSTVATWFRTISGTYGLEAVVVGDDGSTGSAQLLTEGEQARYFDHVEALGSPSGALIAWSRRATLHSDWAVEAAVYTAATGWGARQQLAAASGQQSSALTGTSALVMWSDTAGLTASSARMTAP